MCRRKEKESYLSDETTQWFKMGPKGQVVATNNQEADEEAAELQMMNITGYTTSWLKLPPWTLFVAAIVGVLSWLGFEFTKAIFAGETDAGAYVECDAPGHWGGGTAVCILLISFATLLFIWNPEWWIWITHSKAHLETATKLVIADTSRKYSIVNPGVRTLPNGDSVRYFEFRHTFFLWQAEQKRFQVSTVPIPDLEITDNPKGLSEDKVKDMRLWFGENLIRVPVPNPLVLFVQEILSPFMWFQLFSVTLWGLELYYVYAIVIAVLTVVSALINLKITRDNLLGISAMALYERSIDIVRDGKIVRLSTRELVPGDLFVVESGQPVPCDAILLSGEAIVNESMLTGESIPVVKVPVPRPSPYDRNTPLPARHTLYNGTACLQATPTTHKQVFAQVWRAGFSTSKGRLVRSILFPRPARFDMNRAAFAVIAALFGLAIIGFILTIAHAKASGDFSAGDTVLKAFDLVTIVIPPALPTTLLVGMSFAIYRLRKSKIFSIAPSCVNVAGTIDVCCFDKTGTLTEDGLELQIVHPAEKGKLLSPLQGPAIAETEKMPVLNACMGCCHALRNLDSPSGPILVGDILEVKMFNASGWTISDDKGGAESVLLKGKETIRVNKTFDFSSDYQRMGVIADIGGHRVYVKGAPEKIITLCNPASIPDNWHEEMLQYTKRGFRVLACAWRQLELQSADIGRISREEAEGNEELEFLGLLVFENAIKPESAPTIAALQEARIRTVMITGDHAVTAIHVARESGIIGQNIALLLIGDLADGALTWTNAISMEPLSEAVVTTAGLVVGEGAHIPASVAIVITGKVFDYLVKEGRNSDAVQSWFLRLIERTVVAARFSPYQKQLLVELYSDNGHITGFCGDGANDCGALKAADAGLSLSPYAEASIAAPFTSQITNVSAMLQLMQEGRAALVNSFSCFKFMALYALIQYLCTVESYLIGTTLGNYQFLMVDAFIILPLSLTMGGTRPYHKLVARRPPSDLRSPSVFGSILGQAAFVLVFHIICRQVIKGNSWYYPQGGSPAVSSDLNVTSLMNVTDNVTDAAADPCDSGDFVTGFDNTAVWVGANFQYIWMVLAFSVGRPFRRALYTNVPFLIALAWVLAISYACMFSNSNWVLSTFNLIDYPVYNARWPQFGIIHAQLIVAWTLELAISTILEINKERRDQAAALREKELDPFTQSGQQPKGVGSGGVGAGTGTSIPMTNLSTGNASGGASGGHGSANNTSANEDSSKPGDSSVAVGPKPSTEALLHVKSEDD